MSENGSEQKQPTDADRQAATIVGQAMLGALGMPTPEPEKQPAPASDQPPAAAPAEAGREAAEAKAEEDKKPEEPAHPLLAMAGGKSEPEPVPAEVSEWLKANGVEDFRGTMTQMATLKEEHRQATEKLATVAKDIEYLNGLGPEVMNIIQMELAGQDWKKQVMTRPLTDYRKTFEKQDRSALLGAYGSGRITPEMLEEYDSADPDPRTKAAVEAEMDRIKILYERDRDESVNYLERAKAEHQKKVELRTTSRADSIAYAMNAVPGASAYRKEIEEALDQFESNFMAPDGVAYTPKAALLAWQLKHLDKLLAMSNGHAARQAREQADIELLRRTKEKTPAPSGAGAGKEALSPEDQAKSLVASAVQGIFAPRNG